MKYERILFATDFSDTSRTAFYYATALARDSGALLMIVHVQEPFISYPGGEMLVVQPDVPNPELRRVLKALVPHDSSVRFENHLLIGAPAEEIVRLARESKADLIVIGSQGRTGLSRMLMGSVAEMVMRKAQCPVLTVKAAAAKSTEPEQAVPQTSASSSLDNSNTAKLISKGAQ